MKSWPDESRVNPVWIVGGAALVAAWFLYFAAGGLRAGFTGDDLANMHTHFRHSFGRQVFDNLHYWSTAYRPLGGLFYTVLYRLFGFHPLPFRIACFALLGVNLTLFYQVCRALTESRDTAFLATFLASYHAWFIDLYYNTGTVYDLLCYAFYFSAFLLYVWIRRTGRAPTWKETFVVAALYVGALDAKEMAVSLPVVLLIYELLYHFRRRPEVRTVVITTMLTIFYIPGKLTGPGNLFENPAYRVSISPGRYLDTFHLYLNPLLYQDHFFRDPNTVQLVAAMLILAIVLRSRPLLFAWCFILVTPLPVSFMNHYSAFFMYLPMAGWALYVSTVLTSIRAALAPARWTAVTQVLLVAVVAVFLAPRHARMTRQTLRTFSDFQLPVEQSADQLQALHLRFPKGARVLFVGDPFPADSYAMYLLAELLYDDPTIRAERARTPPSDYSNYDSVLLFGQGRWIVSK